MSKFYNNRFNPESLLAYEEEVREMNQVYADLVAHRITVNQALEALNDYPENNVRLAIEAKVLLYKDPITNRISL